MPKYKRSQYDSIKRCPYCGKQFSADAFPDKHILYPYYQWKLCNQCGKSFMYVDVTKKFAIENNLKVTFTKEEIKMAKNLTIKEKIHQLNAVQDVVSLLESNMQWTQESVDQYTEKLNDGSISEYELEWLEDYKFKVSIYEDCIAFLNSKYAN